MSNEVKGENVVMDFNDEKATEMAKKLNKEETKKQIEEIIKTAAEKDDRTFLLVSYHEGGLFLPIFFELSERQIKNRIQKPENAVVSTVCRWGSTKRTKLEEVEVFSIMFPDGKVYDSETGEYRDFISQQGITKERFVAEYEQAKMTAKHLNI